MFHYNVVSGMNRQSGPRGVTEGRIGELVHADGLSHKLGKGTVQLRGMFSFEPFTFPPGGSPLLFQTGETYKGQPLIDRQHPHDLFMELSAQYTHPVGEHGTWFTYFGYPGEPALGPVAFMHRMSASENPVCNTLASPTGFDAHQLWCLDDRLYLSLVEAWKGRSSTGASQMKIVITSMRINGTHGRHGFG